jgi:asparagine synthase (glutamine-hydrolysing)
MDCGSDDEFTGRYLDYWQRLVPQSEHGSFFNDTTMKDADGWDPSAVFKRVLQGGELDGFYGPSGSTVVESGGVKTPYKPGRFLDAAMYFELKTFLQGLLIIADKLSMANSIEARVPYLDNGLVDFALTIPAEYKYAGAGVSPSIDENVSGKKQVYYTQSNAGKKVLREAMAPLLPPGVLDRNKQGFSPPEGSWYRGPTMAYVRETILGDKSVSGEYFRGDYLKRIVEEHTAGVTNHRLLIWSLLSFEWWCRTWIG